MVVQVKVVLLDAKQLWCNLAYTLSPSLGAQAHELGRSPFFGRSGV